MEAAPLTLAHTHARNAALQTWNANHITAKEEHEQAAGEFSNAAKDTEDSEALRILKLLEDHHQRLAHIIKDQSTRAATNLTPSEKEKDPEKVDPTVDVKDAVVTSPEAVHPTPPAATKNKTTARRRPPRDLTSSIVSNLASARGIPGAQPRRATPISPSVSNNNAGGTNYTRGERQARIERQLADSTASLDPRPPRAVTDRLAQRTVSPTPSRQAEKPTTSSPTSEEPFQRFFSTFENLLSKISAPLAFAGLPLSPEEPSIAPNSTHQRRHSSSTDSEITKIISRPALRALQDDHGPSFGPAESFFVVPPEGGAAPYAEITKKGLSNLRHGPLADIDEDRDGDGEEFVDANETPQPPSPTSTRGKRLSTKTSPAASLSKGQGTSPRVGNRKTMEELELENSTLRQLLDKQSRRLQMWEATSQSQSQALAQSFRLARHPPSLSAQPSNVSAESDTPPISSVPADGVPATLDVTKRLKELEERLQNEAREREAIERENERFARENEKLLGVLGRYREKWEALKAGARGRRESQRQRSEGEGERVGSPPG